MRVIVLMLGMHRLRGEKAPCVKWKITSARLARSDIDADKHHESVNWQTILFFFFFFFVGKNDTKYEVLLLVVPSKKKVVYPTALVLILNHSRKPTSVFQVSRARQAEFDALILF